MQLCVMQPSFSNLFLPLLLPPLPAVDSFIFSTCDSLGRGARHSLHWPYRLDGVPNHEFPGSCVVLLYWTAEGHNKGPKETANTGNENTTNTVLQKCSTFKKKACVCTGHRAKSAAFFFLKECAV